MPTSTPTCLLNLPPEILEMMVYQLDFHSLKRTSLACRMTRSISVRHLFSHVSAIFSPGGFKSLREMAASPLARHIQTFTYKASPIFNHNMALCLSEQSMEEIRAYEQMVVTGEDFLALAAAVQNFSRLSRFILKYSEDNFLADKFNLSEENEETVDAASFRRHLAASLQVLRLSSTATILEIDLARELLLTLDECYHGLARDVFANITELYVERCSALIPFFYFNNIYTPTLQKLSVTDMVVGIEDLVALCRGARSTLRSLHIRHIILFNRWLELSVCMHVFRDKDSPIPISILHSLFDIGKYCRLEDVSVVCEDLTPVESLERLFRGEVSFDEIETVFATEEDLYDEEFFEDDLYEEELLDDELADDEFSQDHTYDDGTTFEGFSDEEIPEEGLDHYL